MKKMNVMIDNFYKDVVVLEGDKISELIDKKNKNIERLQEGINKYNEKNNTNYQLIDNVTQGSVAMCTTINPEYDDFDIDVGIIFDKSNISYLTDNAKDLVIKFLEPYNYLFKENPQKKKNCIRINYQNDYHVDFAIYRKNGDIYEHCGENWTNRDPRAINNWFKEQNKTYNDYLRIMTRFLKYFAKSRKEWKLCGGLAITILVEEQLGKIDSTKTIDIMLLDIINRIINRLDLSIIINNPTNGNNIITTNKHELQVKDFKEKLKLFANDLNDSYVINDYEKICKSWNKFFNTEYFTSEYERKEQLLNNEMFIENLYRIDKTLPFRFEIKCQRYLSKNPDSFIKSTHINCVSGVPFSLVSDKSQMLCFSIETNISKPYQLLWKIKNNGSVARSRNMLRGELCIGNNIQKIDDINSDMRYETIDFEGNHYVECYLIKNNICLASSRFNVVIK